ncbi:hypothetical protein [Streptomyces geranii]|uniref:hypothetical protein n=1 Tax=Streptomyces geranii TaxID=2058923 RepID=UPI0013009ECD|nr:hypothetical protein [Streptomyces geranii]
MSALRRAGAGAVGGGPMSAGVRTAARTGPDGVGPGVRDVAAARAVGHPAWGAGR